MLLMAPDTVIAKDLAAFLIRVIVNELGKKDGLCAYPTAPNTPLTFKVTFPAMRVSRTNMEKIFRPIGFVERDLDIVVGFVELD
jgi:hypothetical protein